MFGNSNNLDDQILKLNTELSTLQRLRTQQAGGNIPNQLSVIDELNKTIGSLTKEEVDGLSSNQAYIVASQKYEAGFDAFLGSKFGSEYVQTEKGKAEAENLIAVLKEHKTQFQAESKKKLDELQELADLIRSNPKIKAEIDSLKTTK